jgi:hypothetical protein
MCSMSNTGRGDSTSRRCAASAPLHKVFAHLGKRFEDGIHVLPPLAGQSVAAIHAAFKCFALVFDGQVDLNPVRLGQRRCMASVVPKPSPAACSGCSLRSSCRPRANLHRKVERCAVRLVCAASQHLALEILAGEGQRSSIPEKRGPRATAPPGSQYPQTFTAS